MSGERERELPPALADAFAALREEDGAPRLRPDAMAAARAAMHRARTAEALRRHRPLAAAWTQLRQAFSPRRLAVTGAGAAAALALVALLGWNAPAGAPLHVVRLAREQIALVLPGADRVALELSDAEARLHDAADGINVSASLDEAARLLGDARAHMPSDGGGALLARWQHDSDELAGLRETAGDDHGGDDRGSGSTPGSTQGGEPGSGRGDSSTESGSSGGGGGGVTTTGSGDGGSDGSGGSQGASTTTSTTSGGHDGSSSTSSTSTSGDGGQDGGSTGGSTTSTSGGGSDGGDGGGGSSSTSDGGGGSGH